MGSGLGLGLDRRLWARAQARASGRDRAWARVDSVVHELSNTLLNEYQSSPKV